MPASTRLLLSDPMQLPTAFRDFLQEIRPTKAQRDDYKHGHKILSDRLRADADLKSVLVAIFIQGSYRRSTAIRPSEGLRSDVDLVVVTNLDPTEVTPNAALGRFRRFLNEHYEGKWRTTNAPSASRCRRSTWTWSSPRRPPTWR